MYVGRIVSIGMTKSGRLAAMYRVSSRSFPNREAKILDGKVSVIPKQGYENDIHKNPYIAYNCLRLVNRYAVVSNGSHTDPITEKLASGMTVRDAMISVLYGMDYEHDSLNTPRIAAVVEQGSSLGCLGIVRHDALLIQQFTLTPGNAFYVCTYEHNVPCSHYHDSAFDADSAADACQYVLGKGVFAELERPITAACALENANGSFQAAAADAC